MSSSGKGLQKKSLFTKPIDGIDKTLFRYTIKVNNTIAERRAPDPLYSLSVFLLKFYS